MKKGWKNNKILKILKNGFFERKIIVIIQAL